MFRTKSFGRREMCDVFAVVASGAVLKIYYKTVRRADTDGTFIINVRKANGPRTLYYKYVRSEGRRRHTGARARRVVVTNNRALVHPTTKIAAA